MTTKSEPEADIRDFVDALGRQYQRDGIWPPGPEQLAKALRAAEAMACRPQGQDAGGETLIGVEVGRG